MASWDPKRGVLYHEFDKFHKERSLREVRGTEPFAQHLPLC